MLRNAAQRAPTRPRRGLLPDLPPDPRPLDRSTPGAPARSAAGGPGAGPGGTAGPGRYLPVAAKFALAAGAAGTWTGVSVWLSLPWLTDARAAVGTLPALAVVALIAWLPGWLVAFLAVSLLLDRQPRLRVTHPTDPVTIVVAARNERAGIAAVLDRLAAQDHAGPITVILADNGSTDGTAEVARAAAARVGLDLVVVAEDRPGKSHALNTALAAVRTPLVITLDADTLPHPGAVRYLVARLHSGPADIDAVAGAVLVRNSRDSVWTRLQEWDYFLGIAAIKRMQGMYQGTLVAQGAFSLYRTEAIRAVGGWPDAIGEDIVVTWQLLRRGGRVHFEPLAVAFTDAPAQLRHFCRQRARWARGMIEGLRAVRPWRQPRPMLRVLTGLDLLIPAIDLMYTFVWIPGLVLAAFGIYWVVGPYTVLVLPLTLLVNWLLYTFQFRRVFAPLGLRIRRNRSGFVLYVLVYQLIMSPVSVLGYTQEVLGLRRRWK